MQQQLIVDADGVWYTNTAQFGFTDPSTKVRFVPGVHVKIKPTVWMASQPTIKLVEVEASAVAEKAPVAVSVASAPTPAPAPAAAPAKAPAAAPASKK